MERRKVSVFAEKFVSFLVYILPADKIASKQVKPNSSSNDNKNKNKIKQQQQKQ